MDLKLFVSVLWRFRLLVAMGILLAVSLAMLSMVRVGTDGIAYRQTELWSSTTRLGVTQRGFPEGRLFAEEATAGGGSEAGDPDRRPEPLQHTRGLLCRARGE